MTGYEAFGLYESLRFHFAKESYDFFKYNGKINTSVTAFENRKDKWHFYKLSRKCGSRDDLITFIVANIVERDSFWVGDLLNEDSEVIFRKRQKAIQSLSYTFENDCKVIFENCKDPNDVLKVIGGEYPPLLKMTVQKTIQFETFCLLAKILGFMPSWNKKINDTIRWPELYRKVIKYTPFLPQDTTKYQLILKKTIHND
jgi:hypothetical protein